MTLFLALNGVIAFALEIAMLIAYGMAGYKISHISWLQWLGAVGAVALVAILWGLVAAPRAQWRLSSPWLYTVSLALMLVAFILLWYMGHKTSALILSVIAVIVQGIAYINKQ